MACAVLRESTDVINAVLSYIGNFEDAASALLVCTTWAEGSDYLSGANKKTALGRLIIFQQVRNCERRSREDLVEEPELRSYVIERARDAGEVIRNEVEELLALGDQGADLRSQISAVMHHWEIQLHDHKARLMRLSSEERNTLLFPITSQMPSVMRATEFVTAAWPSWSTGHANNSTAGGTTVSEQFGEWVVSDAFTAWVRGLSVESVVSAAERLSATPHNFANAEEFGAGVSAAAPPLGLLLELLTFGKLASDPPSSEHHAGYHAADFARSSLEEITRRRRTLLDLHERCMMTIAELEAPPPILRPALRDEEEHRQKVQRKEKKTWKKLMRAFENPEEEEVAHDTPPPDQQRERGASPETPPGRPSPETTEDGEGNGKQKKKKSRTQSESSASPREDRFDVLGLTPPSKSSGNHASRSPDPFGVLGLTPPSSSRGFRSRFPSRVSPHSHEEWEENTEF